MLSTSPGPTPTGITRSCHCAPIHRPFVLDARPAGHRAQAPHGTADEFSSDAAGFGQTAQTFPDLASQRRIDTVEGLQFVGGRGQ